MTLHVRDLWFTFPGWPPTLRGIDLTVHIGQSVFLLGPSGCGKTTLLRCIAGLAEPGKGRISWDEENIGRVPAHRRGVGLLPQDPALFPHLNVWRNVAFSLRYRGIPRHDEREEACRFLDLVGFPDKPDAEVNELSGGQKQRVALARTLAAKPRAVLLDEPFASLDEELRDELGPRVKRLLHEQGVAALWVTHDTGEARRLGDDVWTMNDGRLHR